MNKYYIILFLLIPISSVAQDKMVVFMKNGIYTETPTSSIDSVTFPNETNLCSEKPINEWYGVNADSDGMGWHGMYFFFNFQSTFLLYSNRI